jgi:hypothetical protein
MINFKCPHCQKDLIVSRSSDAVDQQSNQNVTPPQASTETINGFSVNQPIGVGCLNDGCEGELLLKKGQWGAFVGCSRHTAPEACNGKLTLPCQKCSDGQLTVKRNREGTSLFLGCNQYQEANCRSTLSLSDAIVQANNYLRHKEGLDTQAEQDQPQAESEQPRMNERALEEIPF